MPRKTASDFLPASDDGTPLAPGRVRFSRRTLVLLVLLAILIIGSLEGLYAGLRFSAARVAQAHAQATAMVHVQATAKVAAGAYEEFVATSGMMDGFNVQHTFDNPYEQALNPATVSDLTTKWSFPVGKGFSDSAPTVADGVVYVGSWDDNLYALNVATGQKKWSFRTGDAINSTPAVVDGVVYIGSLDHNVYAVDAATGQKKWSFQADDDLIASPMVADGVVYAGSANETLYALDAASGAKKWTFSSHQNFTGFFSSPTVANGVVYIVSSNGNLYAFHISGT